MLGNFRNFYFQFGYSMYSKLCSTIDDFISGKCLPRSEISKIGMSKYNWDQIGKKTISVYRYYI